MSTQDQGQVISDENKLNVLLFHCFTSHSVEQFMRCIINLEYTVPAGFTNRALSFLCCQNEVPEVNKASEAKVPDTSLLQQVTQVLGEIVPHNLSAELTEGAGGPQIVVQGADQTGSEFKITLAQQLLLAQHLLNQVQTQRLGRNGGGAGDGDQEAEQPQITTGRFPRRFRKHV